jgi:hypothetical protein
MEHNNALANPDESICGDVDPFIVSPFIGNRVMVPVELFVVGTRTIIICFPLLNLFDCGSTYVTLVLSTLTSK